MAVVRQGREVVGVLSQAIQQLQVGNSRKSTALLRQLRNDASILSTETQDLLEQLHNVQDYYKGQVEETTHKIGDLSIEKERLKRSLDVAKIELQAKESELYDLRRQLALAESNRDTARKEREAAKDKKDAMIGTAVGVGVAGIIFSVATFGIGTPVAVAATTACTVSAVNYAEKEKDAKRDIDRYNRRISDVEDEITTNRNRVASISKQNESLQRTIQEQEQKCNEYQDYKKQTQNAIAFLQESRNFWGKFADGLEQRSNKAERLHRLLQMAEEKKERSFFKRRGSQTVVMSFIDAWERLREDVQSGSGFIYSITFTCIQCKQTTTALPFTKNKQFICAHCYRAISSK